jgi:hypothetical protein
MSQIKKQYFNPMFSGSYSGLHSFFGSRTLNKSRHQVEHELKKLPEYYLHRPARKRFPRRRVLVFFVNFQIQFDLIDVQKWRKENNGNGYV